ncbi:hypothetical protein NQ317_014262 [Molorchus minor]|uniref:Uncharacterized protein n=1 Tax=Molorchus minor TaxID=1323400 RepID=A0ABQ9JHI5_9CUCU|nr:hypothetical protein NQ317_014262 [Molorchus minor]
MIRQFFFIKDIKCIFIKYTINFNLFSHSDSLLFIITVHIYIHKTFIYEKIYIFLVIFCSFIYWKLV